MTPGLGAFGVVRTGGLPALGIRLVTGSPVNHAVLYVGNGQLVEANPNGAALAPLEEYPDIIWSHMFLTAQERLAIAAAGRGLVGTPYSWVDDACIGLARIFGWHVPEPVRARLNRRTRLMCSQLVDVAYKDAGISLFPDGRIPGDVAPGDLLDLIRHEKIAA